MARRARRSPGGRDRRESSGAREGPSGARVCRAGGAPAPRPSSSASSLVAEQVSARPPVARSRSMCMAMSLPMTRRGPWRRTRASVRATAVAARRSSSVRSWSRRSTRRLDGRGGVAAVRRGASHLRFGQLARRQPAERAKVGGLGRVGILGRRGLSSPRTILPSEPRQAGNFGAAAARHAAAPSRRAPCRPSSRCPAPSA